MGIEVPRIVWAGTGLLAFVAGVVNGVGYLGYEHQALSHMTGTVSLGAVAVGGKQWVVAQQLIAVGLSFIAGSLIAGLLLKDQSLSRMYVLLLSLESICILTAGLLLAHGQGIGASVAAAGCGLQNAMTSFYSGSAIRSTHLTGFFTDFGVVLGQAMRGKPLPRRRIAMWMLVLFGFCCGGYCASKLFPIYGFRSLVMPAVVTALAASTLAAHLAIRSAGEKP